LGLFLIFGDPNALSFEPLLAWIHKLMLFYPIKLDKSNKPQAIPSRSLPFPKIKEVIN